MYVEKRYISDIVYFEEASFPSKIESCSYLSKGTYDWIYIVSTDKKLISKITFDDLIANRQSSHIASEIVLVDGCYSESEIENLFIKTGSTHLVIVDNQEHLLGEYVNYSKELESFEYIRNQYAFALMCSFHEEFNKYLFKKYGKHIAIVVDKKTSFLFEESHNTTYDTFTLDEIDLIPPGYIVINSIISEKLYDKIFTKAKTVLSINHIAERVLLSMVISYAQQNSIRLFFVQGPEKRNRKDNKGNILDLGKCIVNESLVAGFVENDDAYAAIISSGKGIIASRDSITNGYYMVSSDEQIDGLTIINGDRIVKTQPRDKNIKGRIHCFGSCLCFGLCCRDGNTIPDAVQQVINSKHFPIEVLNHGLRNGKYEINDFMRFLDGKYGDNDICVFINRYPDDELLMIKENNITIIDLEPYVSALKGTWYLDNSFHINENTAISIGNLIGRSICNNYSIGQNGNPYKDFNLRERMNTNFPPYVNVYSFDSYLAKLNTIRQNHTFKNEDRIGSIIMTANPFTNGHSYLITHAMTLCKHVFVFVVQEDRFQIPFDVRFRIAKENMKGYSNVTVLGTGEDLTSYLSFPEYFSKSTAQPDSDINISPLNNLLFGKYVCPILGISDRFLGEETDVVTNAYNKYVQNGLRQYGINVTIIPRVKNHNEQVISASDVRLALQNKTISKCHTISATTKRILQEYYQC